MSIWVCVSERVRELREGERQREDYKQDGWQDFADVECGLKWPMLFHRAYKAKEFKMIVWGYTSLFQ